MSRAEDPYPYITSQPQADLNLHFYTTPATPKLPNTSGKMIPFLGRGRMQPPPVPPLQWAPHTRAGSTPPGHQQKTSLISSGEQQQRQQPQLRYPTVPVASVDEPSSKRQSVDDEPSPSGPGVAPQQQPVAGYPNQQYQSQNQAPWYGDGGQPTSAPISLPPQPDYGYSSTSASPSYNHHAHHAHAPTRPAPMYAAPIPTAPSQWTGSGSTQGQDQYCYTGAAAYSQRMQAYQQPQYTSPMHTTATYQIYEPARSASSGPGSIARPTPPIASGSIPPSATVPLVTRRLSSLARSKGAAAGRSATVAAVGSQVPHKNSSTQGQDYSPGAAGCPQLVQAQRVSSQSPQANPTASGVAPNPGAGPSGANITIGGSSMGSEPISSNKRVGLRRRDRTNRRQDSKPYKRAPATSRKSQPITYQGNLVRLQQRCRSQGADESAIGVLGKIFADEISLEALSRRLTDAEAETKEFGIDTGMLYTALLEHPDEENDGYACGLCDIEKTWKHHRDVLRHLRRDHFGISDDCDRWYVFVVGWLMVASVDILLGVQQQEILHQRREKKAPLQVNHARLTSGSVDDPSLNSTLLIPI